MSAEVLQAKYGIVTDAERRVTAAQASAREARIQLENALSQHHHLEDVRLPAAASRWTCDDDNNQIGICYYGPDDEQCLVCGQPEERL